ncbi:unnamed protein product [Cyclocybe aegerita]|uniref:F-box domain-containing protein n=1 Tax=Cyclocybe aegerita TaxID=1973307 RepID=A0A8S0X0U2_CYCAE|nr:unnamed protein product [Cyclocybe aegerita]
MKSEDVPPIVRLPLEVLEVFVELSPVAAKLAISRVSRLFHSLTLRSLYRDISLCSPRLVIGCCRTLTSNRNAASTVRSISISYTHYPSASNSFLSSYYSLIRHALLSLPDLHTLKLLIHDPHLVTLLDHSLFPSLCQFECYLTPSATLVDFLNHHPRINYLQVSPYENTAVSEDDLTLPPLQLPRLRYFAGNVQSVPFIGPSSPLRAAIISWEAIDTEPDLVFAALQRSSRNTLSLLSCRRRGWNLDLIDSVSLRLPEILTLRVSNVLLVDSSPTETYLQTIRSYLHRFTHLLRLRVNCIDYWEMGDVTCQLDQDASTVTEWGEACPSLVEITLPHSDGLSWFRFSGNVWVPDPKHALGVRWLETAIEKKTSMLNSIAEGLDVGHQSESPRSHPREFHESIAAVRWQVGIMLGNRVGISHEGDGDGRR